MRDAHMHPIIANLTAKVQPTDMYAADGPCKRFTSKAFEETKPNKSFQQVLDESYAYL